MAFSLSELYPGKLLDLAVRDKFHKLKYEFNNKKSS